MKAERRKNKFTVSYHRGRSRGWYLEREVIFKKGSFFSPLNLGIRNACG